MYRRQSGVKYKRTHVTPSFEFLIWGAGNCVWVKTIKGID